MHTWNLNLNVFEWNFSFQKHTNGYKSNQNLIKQSHYDIIRIIYPREKKINKLLCFQIISICDSIYCIHRNYRRLLLDEIICDSILVYVFICFLIIIIIILRFRSNNISIGKKSVAKKPSTLFGIHLPYHWWNMSVEYDCNDEDQRE